MVEAIAMMNENNKCIALPYVGNASSVFKKHLSPSLKEYIIIVILTFDHIKFQLFFTGDCDSFCS